MGRADASAPSGLVVSRTTNSGLAPGATLSRRPDYQLAVSRTEWANRRKLIDYPDNKGYEYGRFRWYDAGSNCVFWRPRSRPDEHKWRLPASRLLSIRWPGQSLPTARH